MAEAVLRADTVGKLRCTIGRSSDYYGPRGTGTSAGDNIMKPALRGNRARWLGSLDQPHTLNYLEDMARALVILGERDEADGHVSDATRFQGAFGPFEPTPHAEAVRRTVAWFRRHYAVP